MKTQEGLFDVSAGFDVTFGDGGFYVIVEETVRANGPINAVETVAKGAYRVLQRKFRGASIVLTACVATESEAEIGPFSLN